MSIGSSAQTASVGVGAGMHTYPTGAKRSGRVIRYDLLVHSFLERIAQRATGSVDESGQADGGALKYGEGNWEQGLPTSDVINHTIAHLLHLQDAFRRGLAYVAQQEGTWPERMEELREGMNNTLAVDDHIGAVGWGLMVLCHQLDAGFYHDPLFESANVPPTKEQLDGLYGKSDDRHGTQAAGARRSMRKPSRT
jgi:hypothetical protein